MTTESHSNHGDIHDPSPARQSDALLLRHFPYSKKYSDFSYKIQDSGLAVYAVLLDVRMKSNAQNYIYFSNIQ